MGCGNRKGTIHAEHLVNAGGLLGAGNRRDGRRLSAASADGARDLVTDDIPQIMDILKRGDEFPHVMDPGGESYLRQGRPGLCIGFTKSPANRGASMARRGISAMNF
ncbi:MAG: hypothetical protein R3D84_07590 [Paracoccaceae bacterium]